ncbi:hypothetical protein BJY52DRAFT_1225050 [Lactarius psammicola]|nr:hypothetical protein BJY52DRAFT_1225050 [Lactarius psammicola]
MSSNLIRLIPDHCFDVHVLRTSKQSLIVILLRLEEQHGPCRATESIQEVIRALNLTMRDVEEAWRVWRHDYVRVTLRSGISLPFPSHVTMSLSSSSGFAYIRARIGSACWRRHQGRSPAAFVGYQSLYPPFRYAGTSSSEQPWGWQAEVGPVTQADEVSYQTYVDPGNYTSLAQPSTAQYPQFTPTSAHTPTHAASQQYHAPPQSASVGAWDYLPPPYPPPHGYQSQQQQQQPLTPSVNAGSPPPSPVTAAVEVATRFLEAVNKAVNICIELNAM